MVIRIAPDMFIDDRFGCVTIPKVHDELYRTQRFKTRYPWLDEYKSNVITLGASATGVEEVGTHLSTINFIIDAGVENTDTGMLVDLSPTDKHVIACAAVHGFRVSSIDRNLVYFAEHQFDLNNITPLGLVNQWVEDGLVTWSDHLQLILEDWEKCGERDQPLSEVGRFQQMTGFRYVGP